MATLTLQLDSAESLRANWPAILNTPGKLQELLNSEIVTVAAKAANNADVDWRVYGGRVDLGCYYRAFGEFIAWKRPYKTHYLTQEKSQNVATFILSDNPDIMADYLDMNDGVALPIEPPYVAPVVVPQIPEGDGDEPGAGA
jgi:hypothetical protein